MPIDLDKPLSWKNANADEVAMLDDLQGNILKSHGRDDTAQLFLQFHDPHKGRAFLSALADQVKSASQQLHEAEIYRATDRQADAFVVCFLSHAGYKALEVDERKIPNSTAFREGMKDRADELGDQPEDDWDQLFRQKIHAMVLIADSSEAQTRQHLWQVRRLARQYGVCEIGIEFGKAIKNHHDRNIEHFGYVDGVSVPVMLTEDLPGNRGRWTPEAPLRLAIVRDPGGQDAFSFGSYFVFRKLVQNVRAFKLAEKELGKALGLKDPELAGALVVGRFEDGTPVAISSSDGHSPKSPENNFTYGDDQFGRHCPFHAHIRKVNPRGESADEHERDHLLVRRGITYGARDDDPNEEAPPEQRPSDGVGLLFMAYQASIENGFEHVQKAWANDPNYVKENTGADPIIAWRDGASFQWPARWGTEDTPKPAAFAIEQLVKPKGGEYFFAPSISFLKSLDSKEQ